MNTYIDNDVQMSPISDRALERYLLGELPADELAAISAQESADGGLRDRIAALRRSDAEILEVYPPTRMARRIATALAERTDRARKRRTERIPIFAIPAAVCAALLILLPITTRTTGPAAPYYEDRVKGVGLTAPAIEVWRKEGADARKLAPLTAAKTGDLVQLRYIVPEFCYGAVISVDGRGVLTVHLSGESGKAAPLTPGRPVALENSYQLDDAPLFETFYLVTAKDNFDIESVKQSLRDKKQSLSTDQIITTFTLRK
ncbi:hypothetical protein R80B4_02764 [Fibrobacteres bacterium R8-0-B4]